MAEQTTLNVDRGEIITSVEPDAVFLEARNAYLLANDALNKALEALAASQLVEANAANALSQATTAISLANAAQTTANNALATQVSITGATLTGSLYLSSTSPSAPFEAAAKQYVDSQVATVATDAINSVAALKADTTYVNSQDAALQSQINTGASQIADLYTKLFPVGGIIMWSGSIASIPSGWLLCDGTLGTPDLRNRFILGAGIAPFAVPAQTGGSFTSTTSANGNHNHSLNVELSGSHAHTIFVNGHALTIDQIPSHSHTFRINTRDYAGSGGSAAHYNAGLTGNNPTNPTTTAVGGSQAHTHGAYSDAQGLHSHVGSTSYPGDHVHAVDVTPPFYALCFIMRA